MDWSRTTIPQRLYSESLTSAQSSDPEYNLLEKNKS